MWELRVGLDRGSREEAARRCLQRRRCCARAQNRGARPAASTISGPSEITLSTANALGPTPHHTNPCSACAVLVAGGPFVKKLHHSADCSRRETTTTAVPSCRLGITRPLWLGLGVQRRQQTLLCRDKCRRKDEAGIIP